MAKLYGANHHHPLAQRLTLAMCVLYIYMYVERISECGVRQIIWDQIQRRLNVGDFGCQLPNLLFPAGLTLLHDSGVYGSCCCC